MQIQEKGLARNRNLDALISLSPLCRLTGISRMKFVHNLNVGRRTMTEEELVAIRSQVNAALDRLEKKLLA